MPDMDGQIDSWTRAKQGIKQTLARFVLARNDVTAARYGWVQFLKLADRQRPDGPDVLALQLALTSCIASYGRIFCGDEAPLPVKPPWVMPTELQLHEYLMALRHEMVAHSNRRRRFVRILPRGIVENGREKRVATRHLEFVPPCDTDDVSARLQRLQAVLEEHADAALTKLLEHCKDQPEITKETPLDEF